eukprot:COSAG02_NODE_2510_length_8629_cov_2.483236_4_plen_66_part_00
MLASSFRHGLSGECRVLVNVTRNITWRRIASNRVHRCGEVKDHACTGYSLWDEWWVPGAGCSQGV